MDHRALLAKYMREVINQEGVSFIPDPARDSRCDVPGFFTIEEIAELNAICDEMFPPRDPQNA